MSAVEDLINAYYDKYAPKKCGYIEVFEAFGNGELEPQKAQIYFNKELLEAEEELTRNPNSEKLQSQIAEIEDYLKKISKIIIKTDGQTTINDEIYNSLPASIQVQVNYLFLVHPKFKIYFPFFKEADYIEILEEHIYWKKSKRALTKFIKLFAGDEKNYNWKKYENLFNQTSLRTGEGAYPENSCIEYEELVKKVEG